MAKDKSLKSASKLPKKKKLGSNADNADTEETMDAEVKGKRSKLEVEEAPVQIPQETIADDTKQKKEKKRKKKRAAEETQADETEILDPPSLPEPTRELEGEEDLSPEEKRVLERKMKKILKKDEKKRLKAEGETEKKSEAPGPTAPQQALDYLTCWAEKRAEWKFQKTRQTWLLQQMFDSNKVIFSSVVVS
nr:PREDICTED: uncharacterized protein C7orf50 homolog [Paralichthys olivaceus]